ncbi:hypothetical protein ACFWIA_11010 [Streptomyces sp. NPDC127068]|uniref:hypothetical protein n=1 Tax=Streptomyces sp. NPDC127068 TaxID=3347127 RepID=UPI003659580D
MTEHDDPVGAGLKDAAERAAARSRPADPGTIVALARSRRRRTLAAGAAGAMTVTAALGAVLLTRAAEPPAPPPTIPASSLLPGPESADPGPRGDDRDARPRPQPSPPGTGGTRATGPADDRPEAEPTRPGGPTSVGGGVGPSRSPLP